VHRNGNGNGHHHAQGVCAAGSKAFQGKGVGCNALTHHLSQASRSYCAAA
jgi:hypothetical protein